MPRPSLTHRAVLAPLAASLAQQDWTEAALRQHLHQRLPGDHPAHHRQIVTGLTVNMTVNPSRQSYDMLKATIHHLARADDPRRHDQIFLAQLAGRIAWVAQVNPAKGAKLRDRLATALLTPHNI